MTTNRKVIDFDLDGQFEFVNTDRSGNIMSKHAFVVVKMVFGCKQIRMD